MPLAELIGDSPGIVALREQVARLVGRRAGSRLPQLLIVGETGSGKGLLARALHAASPRRSAPFVDVNCAAIPESLLEAELFGVERGAYTGADRTRPGLFHAAHRGTLFLDEIGLLPPALQGKLLKALEERQVRRLGSTRSEPVDAWILAATNEDLDEAMRAGRFRRDLFHRLAVATLRLPPLRERGADVVRIAEHFLARSCAEYGLPAVELGDDARAALLRHPWPGNVRELANLIERVVLLADEPAVTSAMLDLPAAAEPMPLGRVAEPAAPGAPRELRAAAFAAERAQLLDALEATGWNLSRAAARLEIPRNTLRYRMERHGLREPPPSRRPAEVHVPSVVECRRAAFLRIALAPPSPDGGEARPAGLASAVVDKIRSFGGHVEEATADAVVGVFGLEPVEDAPRRAALAALAAQREAERASHEKALAPPAAVIHVQDCGVVPRASGSALDSASRREACSVLDALTALAPPGAVVLSEAAAAALRRRFALEPLATHDAQAAGAFRLTGREPSGLAYERTTPLVGRAHELALLESRFASAREGRGHVVAVVGEAGIGKSRLVLELRRRVRAPNELEVRCASYGNTTAYRAVRDLLRQLVGVTESDDDAEAARRLDALLVRLGAADDGALYLRMLLGAADAAERLRDVAPAQVKARTFEALRRVVVALAREHPTLLVAEDLHWIDTTSDEFLAALVDGIAAVPLLVVATYRPGYEACWPARADVTQLALPPLSASESGVVVRSVLRSAPVSPGVAELILARGQGNPFFLEELAHAVLEGPGEGSPARVPDTVHAVLAARIDRLPAGERRVLQAASVLGKDVPLAALAALVGDDAATLAARLRKLQAADLLLETRPGEHGEYTFKHALTQEVAHATLAPEARCALHTAAARLAQGSEAIARHLTAADRFEEAIPHWLAAGRSALRRSANVEAVSHLKTALELLLRRPETPERDRQELEIQLALGPALFTTRGYAAPHNEVLYRRARALCERIGDSAEMFSALWGIFIFDFARGALPEALAAGEQLRHVATRLGSADLLLEAVVAIGVCLISEGRLAEGRRNVEEAIALHDPERHAGHAFVYGQDPLVAALAYRAWALVVQGHEAEALAAIHAALRRADVLGHAFSRAMALYFAAVVDDLRDDPTGSLRHAERLIALSEEHGFPFWQAGGVALRGRALAGQGRLAEGIEVLTSALESSPPGTNGLALSYFLRNLAEAHLRAGDFPAARTSIEQGLDWCDRCELRSSESEIHRLRGELLALDPATSAEAEEAFEHAIELARAQGALLYVRRAARSYASHLRRRGRASDAERLLADAQQAR